MATIKSYTDISQSKVLANILPLESADMYIYKNVFFGALSCFNGTTQIGEYIKLTDKESKAYPCWSLAALLKVLPQSISKYIETERCQKTFHLNLFRSYYHCVSYSFISSISDDDSDNTLYCVGRDNWVDACCEMILKLHKLKKL